jgi:uroporphyrinogen decarboxylase
MIPAEGNEAVNEKQRVKHCIRFERTDVPPWQIGYTSGLAEKVIKEVGLEIGYCDVRGKNIFRYNRLDDFFGNHIAFLRGRATDSVKEVSPGIWRDEWGVLWDRRIDPDIGTPVNCVLDDMDLESLLVPDPEDERRFCHFPLIAEANSHRYLLVKVSYSLFERAWSLRGMENLLMDFILNPAFVRELFERITVFNLELIDSLRHFRVDGVIFGDDYGWQRGLLMNPDTWREFLRPCLEKIYGRAHEHGYDVFIHSCGEISAILDDLVEIGVNVFNPFQPEVMDTAAVIRKYSGRLAFYGGISIQRTLPFGTPEEVRRQIRILLDLADTYGGFIVAPSHDMPNDIPIENILAMRDALGVTENGKD